ncbi:MAG: Asp-tRNA(Asn)/Glu-tRNA(Gln) amidotransferase GatCAB subunit C [Deltaproteobacteria bacterium CG11_big_fil_rev_8_21_14_0_20_45_16]|nr:MAG: Asp-tRNA(Asn)/Glu-tRNA(Gln) amidotransferase GatCAB subunit C [Deltaproteobacteria bacterium CG11_big_fil_rev_8_21_14_0_20_45_16]
MAEFDVDKVASLAYLKLNDTEKKNFSAQFAQILDYVDQLQKIPMSADEAKTMGAFHVQTAFYEMFKIDPLESLRNEKDSSPDFEKLILSNEEALMNAPRSSGLPNQLLFEVPSIIDR